MMITTKINSRTVGFEVMLLPEAILLIKRLDAKHLFLSITGMLDNLIIQLFNFHKFFKYFAHLNSYIIYSST